jgi:hypothetical protein
MQHLSGGAATVIALPVLLRSGHLTYVTGVGVDEPRQSADVVVLIVDVVASAHRRYPCCPTAVARGRVADVE